MTMKNRSVALSASWINTCTPSGKSSVGSSNMNVIPAANSCPWPLLPPSFVLSSAAPVRALSPPSQNALAQTINASTTRVRLVCRKDLISVTFYSGRTRVALVLERFLNRCGSATGGFGTSFHPMNGHPDDPTMFLYDPILLPANRSPQPPGASSRRFKSPESPADYSLLGFIVALNPEHPCVIARERIGQLVNHHVISVPAPRQVFFSA